MSHDTDNSQLNGHRTKHDIHDEKSSGHKNYGKKKDSFKTVYLVLFNTIQTIGFSFILISIAMMYYKEGYDSLGSLYEELGFIVRLLHIMQLLESVHPMIGYAKGGPMIPFVQLAGRFVILYLMLEPEPRIQKETVVPYLFAVWGTIEIIRHTYYIFQLLNIELSLLTWIRYSVWMALYPMGITGEAAVMIKNLPYFKETMRYSITLPNAWNFSIDMVLLMKLQICALVGPIMFLLTSHMYKMRVKKMADFKLKPFIRTSVIA